MLRFAPGSLHRLLSAKPALAGLAVAALLGAAACDSRTTGVWQLPAPPQRDVTSFNQSAPINGPTISKTNDCKQSDAGYRLGAGGKLPSRADPDVGDGAPGSSCNRAGGAVIIADDHWFRRAA